MDWNKIFDGSSKLAALLAAGFSIVLSFKYDGISKKLRNSQDSVNIQISQLNMQISDMDRLQDSVDFDRKHRFNIYEKVFTAVESGNKNKKELATILVKEMLPGDEYQESLLRVIKESGENSPVAEKIINKTIDQLQTIKVYNDERRIKVNTFQTKTAPNKKDYLVDVFYLESKAATLQPRAAALESLLTKNGFDARMRKLSDVVNARPGYRVYTNQVRVETGNAAEAEIGKELITLMGNAFAITPVTQASPGYISIFIVE